jgi:hypothetical protein
MRKKKSITCVAFLLLGLGGLQAQETSAVSGGEAAGVGGTSSYTVGQTVYTGASGIGGSLSQGVQQSYDVSIIAGVEITSINLEVNAYPNPTINNLTVKVEDANDLSYQFYDLKGSLVLSETVISNVTLINLEGQSSAVYFLKVLKNNQELKTFKIIKN